MNKPKLYVQLQALIDAGVADLIIDSPHQNKELAPYVVVELVKKTPRKQIPYLVLEQLGEDMISEAEPKRKWWQFKRTK